MNLTDNPVTIPAKQLLARATEISEQTDDMVRNYGMEVTSTIRCDKDMINDWSVISPTSHSVPS